MTWHPLILEATPAGLDRALVVVVLPVLLGLLGVYWLLPRPRGARPLWGALAAGLALVLGGWLLFRSGMAAVESVLFYVSAAIAIIAGVMFITQRNPVHAALSFALVVLSTCALFLLQAAPFLMAATIIIYAGAIIVTFLFVIMLAQQQGISNADQRSREPLLSCIAAFVLLGAILIVLHVSYDHSRFEGLLERVGLAARASSLDEMKKELGDGNDVLKALRSEKANAHLALEQTKDFETALGTAEEKWSARNRNLAEIRGALIRLYEAGAPIRDSFGSPIPPEYSSILPPGPDGQKPRLQLSHYSRLRSADSKVEALADSQGRGLMPADNVAYLGRTLFSDYLLAVELGGTLLLVATIGAIAIAGRRREGLR
jgi:NADH-quinone oxidoreductase subunit J